MALARRRAAVDEPQDEHLDDAPEPAQSHAEASDTQGDDPEAAVGVNVARRLGWRSKDEWSRDPSKWTDWREYLDNLPGRIEALRESRRRTAQAADAAIEDARRRGREEAQAELESAVQSQDPEAARRAAQKLAQNSGVHPSTQAWLARNGWMNTDPDAAALAKTVAERLSRQGVSVEEQLEQAEAEVRRRFPEHFGNRAEERPRTQGEVRMSERAPPMVAAGTRSGNPPPKVKGFADIPSSDQAQYRKYFARRYQDMGMSPQDAQAKYAQAYWDNRGE